MQDFRRTVAKHNLIEEWWNEKLDLPVWSGNDRYETGGGIYDTQSLTLSGSSGALALEIHGKSASWCVVGSCAKQTMRLVLSCLLYFALGTID